jgi:hypothetical protein
MSSLSIGLRSSWSPPCRIVVDGWCLSRPGPQRSGRVYAALGTRWSMPTLRGGRGCCATVVTALLTKESSLTLWTLVDDRRLGQTCGQAESDLVRRTLAQAEAALSTRVVAIGLAAPNGESATARTAHPLVRRWSSIVTQRGFPPVAAGGGASSCPSKPAGGRHGPGDPGWRRPGWDHRRSAPDARPQPAVG